MIYIRCPICQSLCGEFTDKLGTTYTCSNIIVEKDKNGIVISKKACPWTGKRELKK